MCLPWIAKAISSLRKQGVSLKAFLYRLQSLAMGISSSNFWKSCSSSGQFFMLQAKLVILVLKCRLPSLRMTAQILSRLSQHCRKSISSRSRSICFSAEGQGSVAIIWLSRTSMRSARLASRSFLGRIFSLNSSSWMWRSLRLILSLSRLRKRSSLSSYSLVLMEYTLKGFGYFGYLLGSGLGSSSEGRVGRVGRLEERVLRWLVRMTLFFLILSQSYILLLRQAIMKHSTSRNLIPTPYISYNQSQAIRSSRLPAGLFCADPLAQLSQVAVSLVIRQQIQF